jgi:hypothetical protein
MNSDSWVSALAAPASIALDLDSILPPGEHLTSFGIAVLRPLKRLGFLLRLGFFHESRKKRIDHGDSKVSSSKTGAISEYRRFPSGSEFFGTGEGLRLLAPKCL